MKKQRTRRQRAIIRRRIFVCACAAILALVITGIVCLTNVIVDIAKNEEAAKPTESASQVTQPPKEPELVSEITVMSIGDIMGHSPQLKGAYNAATKQYDFSTYFKEIKEYFSDADLAVGNLEVTFGGAEAGEYRGYPTFNCPDSLADSIKDANISVLLTANNHSYDTGLSGMKRTVTVLEEKGIEYTGTRQSDEKKNYLVKDVKGIKIGMANFTYETTNENSIPNRKYLNGILLNEEANGLINSFAYNRIEEFYDNAQQIISEMKDEGAEFITFYMHWGEEYQLSQNTWQKTIAQQLCNMGVDMIIGGHPHVVQPIELITSEDSENTTVCVYSLGNAVSNQRQGLINACKTGHTEDGLIFSYCLEKFSDGTVNLVGVDAIPTWVNKYSGGGGYLYTIYPLESEDYGATEYGLSASAKNSYLRTKQIIAEGLRECQKKLGCEVRFKEEE